MGIHRHCRPAKRHIQHHIGRFTPNTRQSLQRLAVFGHHAIVMVDQGLRQGDNIFSLGPEKTNDLHVFPHFIFAQPHHFFGRIGDFEQSARCLVHPGIGGLRG